MRSTGRPSVSEKPGLKARQAATKILAAVVDRKIPLDGMLDADHGNPVYRELSDADRALVRAILNSALRHLPRIEAAIGSLLKAPLPDGARSLQHVLNTAAAQIFYLDVPDHSAVDLAVEQANLDPRARRFASVVNAVLRRLAREKEELLASVSSIPVIPAWFFARLVDVYGASAAEAIAAAQEVPAGIDLTLKSGALDPLDPAGWAERLGGRLLPTGSVRLPDFDGAIPSLPGFADGTWWVQDAAASIPAQLFGDVAGQRILDACAAPGGKTAQLVSAGAKVTALDQSASRLRRLRENLGRLALEAETVHSDIEGFAPEEPFDGILLDAPCSSTGTIRRHPDVLWTKGPADIAKLAQVQRNLLQRCLPLVKVGGLIVFSNCSLDPLEGEAVVAEVLRDNPLFERVPIEASRWPGLEDAITSDGAFRTTPAMTLTQDGLGGGMDGFFAAVLRRQG